MRTVAIIQARMGSTRLPGKIQKNIMGKSVLQHVIERVRQASSIDEIVIATTTLKQDDIVVEEAQKCCVKYFRGSEEDVLSRYYFAAEENKADIVVRITSDCPLIDPIVTNEIVSLFKEQAVYDIVTNASSDLRQRTYPRGLDTEVFSFNFLEKAYKYANKQYQREHVTPYIYENSKKIFYYKNDEDFSAYRLTLDTEEDFVLIKEIYRHLYTGKHDFYLKDIIKLFEQHPNLSKINENVEQKRF